MFKVAPSGVAGFSLKGPTIGYCARYFAMFVDASPGCGNGFCTGAPRPRLVELALGVWATATDAVNAMAATATALQNFMRSPSAARESKRRSRIPHRLAPMWKRQKKKAPRGRGFRFER